MPTATPPLPLRLAAHLPLPLLHGVGALCGLLAAHIPSGYRRVMQRNLELCFPHRSAGERRRLLRHAFIETGKTVMEMPKVWLLPGWESLALIRCVEGEDLVRAAVAAGHGVIAVSPHLGNWELCGLYLSAHYGITSLYRPPRTRPHLAQMVQSARERLGARLVPTDARGVRALYQALARNEMIGILPDQDPRQGGGAFAPFFGVDANTMTLLPRLCGRSGAHVLFCFAERLPHGRGFRLRFLPAPAGIDHDDPVVAARALNEGVENCVRERTEQYQWGYKRFRTRPEGEARLY